MQGTSSSGQRGVTLVEVLVTLVILAIGLLGLVALQARVQVLQAESYQRAQALILLKDMAGRIANNRSNAATYAADFAGQDMATEGVGAHLDAGNCLAPVEATPRAQADVADWCIALRGAAESLEDGSNVGAMVGGRGCIQDLEGGRFLLTVAWQGLAPIQAPPETVTCGVDQYGEPNTPCGGNVCRRVVTTVVQFADLEVDPL